MNIRNILQAALGLRGLFPPFLTRILMTVVLIAPALWAHVETTIIAVTDPASLKSTIPDRISLIHGALSGVISKDALAPAALPKDVERHLSSPLDEEFKDLLSQVHAGSGGEGSSLLAAFKGFFGTVSSSSSGEGKAPFGGNENEFIGTLGPMGFRLLAGMDRLAPAQSLPEIPSAPLVVINQADKSFDGEVSETANDFPKPWTTPDRRPIADPPLTAPGPQALSSNSSSGFGWGDSTGSGPTLNVPPQTYVNNSVESSPQVIASNALFHTSSVASNPDIVTTFPSMSLPRASSSIVLASVPVRTSSPVMTSAALVSSGTASTNAQAAPQLSANINYQFVTVGNPGNANNTVGIGGAVGAVGYIYSIGEYDVTLGQYVTFLNAVAKSDPYGLYNSQMASDATIAGISQTGTSGNYVYAVIGDSKQPVTYVSWFDAARLANWMQNGQPVFSAGQNGEVAGSTETGAYTLNGATSGVILKNSTAIYYIPTESEWYKAAYYDPTLNGGAGGYWQFATRSNTVPGNNAQTPTVADQANWNNSVYSVTQSSTYNSTSQNYLTEVGEFTNSASYYGTYDQNGLVYQWTDAVLGTLSNLRGQRGGSWQQNVDPMWTLTATDSGVSPTEENSTTGIRLVMIPEPAIPASLLFAGGLLLARRRQRSSAS